MALIVIDGLKVYDNLKGEAKDIIIESNRINEGMQLFYKKKLHGVAISPVHGYNRNEVDFLKDYPLIKHISISGISNVDGIYALKDLESLYISGEKLKIDFEAFPNLKKLIIDWSPFLLNIDQCSRLETLSFYKYKPLSKDVSLLSNINWLKSLTITQSPINSLKGLERFAQLEKIELNYCSKLHELCCLEGCKETLTTLLLNHCKSIQNYDYARGLKNVNVLAYNNCGNIPSIKFIEKMPSLKDFRFVGTDVTDGDISPCIGLNYAGFFNKKHYSHTSEQISSLSKT
ncbi:protein phosphatase 1 regulatory subunit 7 [Mucilaginibacter sp. UYP25]|uniref:hypothetical protein n=1 Tax=unclassified Mucilaginibacter TaxID=2617802 RepID=UPI003390A48B